MKWTESFVYTLREAPAEAEIASHQLLLRAGLIRKLASGVYTFMPLGLRALRKVENIVREEMDRSGALETLMPALHPIDLWQESKRYDAAKGILFHVKDHGNRDWVLGPTHEEVVTKLVANEIHTYKQLPKNLYQIQTKFRDETRPRFGLLRAREFIMKDAYSFDVDDAGANKSYQSMYNAYCNIFTRVGLNYRAVLADTGVIGGNHSHEFCVPASTGESEIAFTDDGSYAASIEKAAAHATERKNGSPDQTIQEFETPNVKTIEALASAPYGVAAIDQIKTLVYLVDSKIVVLLVRGDHQLNEFKMAAHLKCVEWRAATEGEIVDAMGARPGSLGAYKLNRKKVHRVIADAILKDQHGMTTGANKDGIHIRNVSVSRDLSIDEYVDIRTVKEGELSLETRKPLRIERAIEIGHVFKLGTKYSQVLNAMYLDEKGQSNPMVMGCYGIGVTRTLQAVIEQHHDKDGICWPMSVAPYHIALLELDPQDAKVREVCEKLYKECQAAGWDVLWDDRNERPGIKFKDADLIGLPWRVTVGSRSLANGGVEIKSRCSDKMETVPVDQAIKRLKELTSSASA